MKKITLLTLLLSLSSYIFAQMTITWQVGAGGTGNDQMRDLVGTADGGVLIVGNSDSGISGSKTTASYGSNDYWIIKLNSDGTEEWQRSYGGSYSDVLVSVVQCDDGGYLLGGYSNSLVSGVKTESRIGLNDYWVIKIDATGNIQWQNTIGGSGNDELTNLVYTSDNGFLLLGKSYSSYSGDKTENAHFASYDYWIVKLNSTGSITWQNTIGGSAEDIPADAYQNPDGTYIVAGSSKSQINGDKTEDAHSEDYWVLKLGTTGNIIWQNTIQGNFPDYASDIIPALDGGIIVTGSSFSNATYDKTEPIVGSYDLWVLKLNDLGNIVWQNTIGGFAGDYVRDLVANPEKNEYLALMESLSGIGGDKTQISYGPDYWLVALDLSGNVVNQEVNQGEGLDIPSAVAIFEDGSYAVGGYSSSTISYDKTIDTYGGYDYYVLKIGNCGLPEICNDIDDNCDGLVDNDVEHTAIITAGGATTFCSGNNVTLSVAHTGNYVQWKKNGIDIVGATGTTYIASTNGDFTCSTFSECDTSLSNTIVVTVNGTPNAVVSAGGPTSFCEGESVTLSVVPVGGCTYKWYKGESAIGGANSTTYVATTSGNYKCRVNKTATGCNKFSSPITVSVVCKEEDNLSDKTNITIYPNPTSDVIQILATDVEKADIQIINSSGGLVKEIKDWQNESINVSSLPSGVYAIHIICNGEVYRKFFVKA